MWIDTHAHIDAEAFDGDRDEVLSRARAAGVEVIIVAGAARSAEDIRRTTNAADPANNIFASCGVHPHEAKYLDDELMAELMRASTAAGIVAIGESGLDYHYDHSPRDQQRQAFAKHLDLAGDRELPIICHIRNGSEPDTAASAHADAAELLAAHPTTKGAGGVIHCFTGGPDEARIYLEMGLYLSFSGILTFGASAEPIREAAKLAPADRILVETDAPFLAPKPMRGKRNEPAFVVHTGAAIAALRGVSVEELAQSTSENAKRLFKLDSQVK